jgi:hypothetical protein
MKGLFNRLIFTLLIFCGLALAGVARAQPLQPQDASNHALSFDGADDFVRATNNAGAFNFPNGFTLEAWVKPSSTSATGQYGGLVHGPGDWVLFVDDNDSSNWGMSVCVSACNSAEDNPGSLVVGTWTHLAGTFDGTTIRIYKNGVLVDQTAHAGTTGNPSELIIGKWTIAFHGVIDEVRLWNYARSASEIASTMNLSLSGSVPGLQGSYRFDEGSGQSTADSAGDNDGRLGSTTGVDADDPAWVVSDVPVSFQVQLPLVRK